MSQRYCKGYCEGYFSLEASLIFPIVIFIVYLLVGLSIYLFEGCYKMQEDYINNFYLVRYNDSLTKEAIYGDMDYYNGEVIDGIYHINPLVKVMEELNGN